MTMKQTNVFFINSTELSSYIQAVDANYISSRPQKIVIISTGNTNVLTGFRDLTNKKLHRVSIYPEVEQSGFPIGGTTSPCVVDYNSVSLNFFPNASSNPQYTLQNGVDIRGQIILENDTQLTITCAVNVGYQPQLTAGNYTYEIRALFVVEWSYF